MNEMSLIKVARAHHVIEINLHIHSRIQNMSVIFAFLGVILLKLLYVWC